MRGLSTWRVSNSLEEKRRAIALDFMPEGALVVYLLFPTGLVEDVRIEKHVVLQ